MKAYPGHVEPEFKEIRKTLVGEQLRLSILAGGKGEPTRTPTFFKLPHFESQCGCKVWSNFSPTQATSTLVTLQKLSSTHSTCSTASRRPRPGSPHNALVPKSQTWFTTTLVFAVVRN